jgi:thiosulfate dehydrogenase [quinone] large subunit
MCRWLNFSRIEQQSTGLAYMIGRWILGISFFNAAIWKIFVLTPVGHTEKFFIANFQHSWIPIFILWLLGLTIPFIELLIGSFLCLGFKTKTTAFITGLLLIITTYGHSLMEPLYNISQGLTFARVALVLFLLVTPNIDDRLCFDHLIKVIKQRRETKK